MARKFRLCFVFCAFFLLIGQTANARDGLFGVGARFAWENYRTPIVIQTDDSLSDVSPLHKTNFGGDFQVRPIDRLVISLALDMGFSKYTVYPHLSTGSGNELKTSAKCFSFGFLLGLKFYVIEPRVKKAALYLKLDGGKYIAKAKNNASSLDPALAYQLSMLSDLASPLVFQFAVGAEFFAAESFSVGADVLGVRFSYSKGDNGAGPAEANLWTGDQKLLNFSLYSALTLNFGFYKGESSASKIKEDAVDAGWGASGSAGNANGGWGSSAAPAGNGGWDAAPPPPPAGDGGWGTQPSQAVDNESPIKPNKSKSRGKGKSKAKSSDSEASAPPPPPPGY